MTGNLSTSMIQYMNQQKVCSTVNLLANMLWKDRNVLCLYHGYSLVNEKIDLLLNFHRDSIYPAKSYNLNAILDILKDLIQLPELPGVIDIGELKESFPKEQTITKESLIAKLWYLNVNNNKEAKDVILYGFGRIGRLLARELCTDPALKIKLNLRAVVTRDPIDVKYLKKRASLLQKDSIHGSFPGVIDIDEQTHSIIVNGKPIRFINASNPQEIDYKILDVKDAILIDNTGQFRDRKSLSKHLRLEIESVILTAPGKGIPNIVFGINHNIASDTLSSIYSTASCTTNAISPVLNLIQQEFGITKGHIETIHAYTNDQNLVDNMHAKNRRGRAAALNMVITETGAGEAVSKIIPVLKDKLTSNAIRVPVSNGSLAILILELNKKTTVSEVHSLIMRSAATPSKHKQIDLSFDEDLVSSDIVGLSPTGIVDGCATHISQDGHTLTLYVWYDNEYGYSMQVLRFACWLSNSSIQRPLFGDNGVMKLGVEQETVTF